MSVTVNPTPEQRVILERIDVPDRLAVVLRLPRFTLGADDARTLSVALGLEMARNGFDRAYNATAEGRLIEDLIDQLFIP